LINLHLQRSATKFSNYLYLTLKRSTVENMDVQQNETFSYLFIVIFHTHDVQ